MTKNKEQLEEKFEEEIRQLLMRNTLQGTCRTMAKVIKKYELDKDFRIDVVGQLRVLSESY